MSFFYYLHLILSLLPPHLRSCKHRYTESSTLQYGLNLNLQTVPMMSSVVQLVQTVPMMSSRVKRGIREAMEDKCLDMSSARVEYMKNLGKEVISKIEENVELLDEFSAKLHASFDKVCKTCRNLKLHSSMRARMWSGFHKATLSELPPLWETLFSSLGILECKDKLLS